MTPRTRSPLASGAGLAAAALAAASLVPFGALLAASSGCTTTDGTVVHAIPPEPKEDQAYAPVLSKWSSRVNLVDQFQKRIEADAVLLGDQMRKAYAERWVRIQGRSEAEIEGLAGGKLAVFVSVYTPENDFLEIDNRQLWSLGLRVGAQGAQPSLVKKLAPKSAFQPFFPFISQWTNDYIVVFDASSSGLGNAALVNAPEATFTMRSSLASLEFRWK